MAAFSLKGKGALLACFAVLAKNAAGLTLRRYARFARVRSLYSLLNKFNTDAVRTSSVARVGVGKGAGAPRNSERRPLTSIAHNAVKR